MNGVERFARNFGEDLNILFSGNSSTEETNKKVDRTIALALRIFGMIGIAACIASAVFALAASGPVGIVATLALGALGIILSRDLMVIGNNMSEQLNGSAVKDLLNGDLKKPLDRAVNDAATSVGIRGHEDVLIAGTWIIKPISDCLDAFFQP